jgi:predicted metal-dependent hydrolase
VTTAQQWDWFGLFAPSPGVHKAPPPVAGPRPAASPGSAPVPPDRDAEGARPEWPQHPKPFDPPDRAPNRLIFQRSPRARNYRLTLRRDGVAVATIPARGSQREAERFVERNGPWLDRARERQRRRPRAAEQWRVGTHVLWRGELTEIRPAAGGTRPQVCLAADLFRVRQLEGDLRPALEAQFARRARIELPARAWELAAVTGVGMTRAAVRNQRSRWGSCTAAGVISLNWRLVQTPDFVRDYIVYHELMHLREMNHSARFWARVEEVCPEWRAAERWIKRNGGLVGL